MNWFLFLKVDAVSRTRLKESCSYGVDRKSGRLGGREIIVRGDDEENHRWDTQSSRDREDRDENKTARNKQERISRKEKMVLKRERSRERGGG